LLGDVVLSKQDREGLEEVLGKGDLCGGATIRPVWMVGDKDGDLVEGDVTMKDQGRWLKYAQRG